MSLLARVEEQFLVRTYASARPAAWAGAHATLTLPFQMRGAVHRYSAEVRGVPVTVLAAGRRKLLEPFCARLLGRLDPAGADAGRRALWGPAALADLAADLVAVEVHRWAAPRFRQAGWLIAPASVRWIGDLATWPPESSKSLRGDLHRLRQHRYVLEQATAPGDWDEFYATMLVPQARDRFGAEAWLPSPDLMRAFRAVGTLHFVLRGTDRVAGVCTVRRGNTLWLPLTAIRRSDPQLRREGAVAATIALPCAWGRTQGCERVDWGRTEPFPSDGIAQYKRKWGFRPVPDPLSRLIALRVGAGSAIQAALARMPFYLETDGGIATTTGERP